MTNLSLTFHAPSLFVGIAIGAALMLILFFIIEFQLMYSEKENAAFGRGWSKGYDYGRNMKKLAEGENK